MTARVAVPVKVATLSLYVEKGRRWSAIEHLLLHAVSVVPSTADKLCRDAKLPWRVIVEVMSRLMRVGWVHIVSSNSQVSFAITPYGQRVVGNDILPAVTTPMVRRATFAIEEISGCVFRARDLSLISTYKLTGLLQTDRSLMQLTAEARPTRLQLDRVVAMFLDEDEHCKGLDSQASRMSEKFALVTVTGDIIDGLPGASNHLSARILSIAKQQSTAGHSLDKPPSFPAPSSHSRSFRIAPDGKQLLQGGNAHRRAIERLLKNAKSWVIIHSTFVEADRFKDLYPLFEAAARRGVRIDILWGKSDTKDRTNVVAEQVERCRASIRDEDVVERVRLHTFSTNSHAKLLAADNNEGGWVGIVGSCNWLSSGFSSYDISVAFTDTAVIAEILSSLTSLATGPTGWSQLACDLAVCAANLGKQALSYSGEEESTCVSLVFGSEHSDYVRRARSEANKSITFISHRIRKTASTLALAPANAAASESINVRMFYGLAPDDDADRDQIQFLIDDHVKRGIEIRHVMAPKLHAKVLLWDDDFAVVTSQNWLSADPPEDKPYSEIGVYIHEAGIAKSLATTFLKSVSE
ncbi:Cardiolipin synthase B [Paraburkholderia aspalathi]|uniref:phospholipase D-like domain-containing protein n=1 Tax=Paraburkholderia aspalathi TaxID=1324617 RepID=UPI001B2EA323|nr:phospholipase D-like domain-containing protein [Paraburkholderia aspalathi]CAE6871739.1 Cardiolipin synthase B [Paraburkholderia aspalathi]